MTVHLCVFVCEREKQTHTHKDTHQIMTPLMTPTLEKTINDTLLDSRDAILGLLNHRVERKRKTVKM